MHVRQFPSSFVYFDLELPEATDDGTYAWQYRRLISQLGHSVLPRMVCALNASTLVALEFTVSGFREFKGSIAVLGTYGVDSPSLLFFLLCGIVLRVCCPVCPVQRLPTGSCFLWSVTLFPVQTRGILLCLWSTQWCRSSSSPSTNGRSCCCSRPTLRWLSARKT